MAISHYTYDENGLYSYSFSDPVNFIDQDGRQAAAAVEGGGAVVLAGVVALIIYGELKTHPEAWEVFRPFTESCGKNTTPKGRDRPRPGENYCQRLPGPPPPQKPDPDDPRQPPPVPAIINPARKELMDHLGELIDNRATPRWRELA